MSGELPAIRLVGGGLKTLSHEGGRRGYPHGAVCSGDGPVNRLRVQLAPLPFARSEYCCYLISKALFGVLRDGNPFTMPIGEVFPRM